MAAKNKAEEPMPQGVTARSRLDSYEMMYVRPSFYLNQGFSPIIRYFVFERRKSRTLQYARQLALHAVRLCVALSTVITELGQGTGFMTLEIRHGKKRTASRG